MNTTRTGVGNAGIINFNRDDVNLSKITSKLTDFTNNYGELQFYTNGVGGNTEKMRIDEDGNVGIGKTPSNKLDVDLDNLGIVNFSGGGASDRVHMVVQNANSAIQLGICGAVSDFFTGTADGDGFLRAQHQVLHIGCLSDDNIQIYTNDNEKLRITK